jgi:hypothetical protein
MFESDVANRCAYQCEWCTGPFVTQNNAVFGFCCRVAQIHHDNCTTVQRDSAGSVDAVTPRPPPPTCATSGFHNLEKNVKKLKFVTFLNSRKISYCESECVMTRIWWKNAAGR